MDQENDVDLSEALDTVERYLLGEAPSLTRIEVCERAGVPLEVAQELWRLLGFAHQPDDAVAFTPADVQALEYTHEWPAHAPASSDAAATDEASDATVSAAASPPRGRPGPATGEH